MQNQVVAGKLRTWWAVAGLIAATSGA